MTSNPYAKALRSRHLHQRVKPGKRKLPLAEHLIDDDIHTLDLPEEQIENMEDDEPERTD